jgi:hypothetical protein
MMPQKEINVYGLVTRNNRELCRFKQPTAQPLGKQLTRTFQNGMLKAVTVGIEDFSETLSFGVGCHALALFQEFVTTPILT